MKGYWLLVIGIVLSTAAFAKDSVAVVKPDKPKEHIYQGTQLKFDIASPIVVSAVHSWKMQHYEAAVNVRLAKRFYPTFEIGYAGGSTAQGDTINYKGQGGFFRVGCDINPLKKNATTSPHALLIGLRIGTAVQDWHHNVSDKQTGDAKGTYSGVAADCWGEIIAGCQVEIVEVGKTAFYMGWMGRFKFLFTREAQGKPASEMSAVYIPGFGKRDDIGWGLNYYLGWRF